MFTLEEQKIIDQALEIAESKRFDKFVNTTSLAQIEATLHLSTQQREIFTVFFLNSQYQLIAREDLFQGTINAAQVYIREIAIAALKHNAAAIIIAHNHPSGCLEPSDSDRRLTDRIIQVLKPLDIQVLDHILVAKGDCISFAESGFI